MIQDNHHCVMLICMPSHRKMFRYHVITTCVVVCSRFCRACLISQFIYQCRSAQYKVSDFSTLSKVGTSSIKLTLELRQIFKHSIYRHTVENFWLKSKTAMPYAISKILIIYVPQPKILSNSISQAVKHVCNQHTVHLWCFAKLPANYHRIHKPEYEQ